MAYEREISRQNKACFLFLLDQSTSMEEPLGNSPNLKRDELATAINAWLQNMTIRASGGGGIKDWMDIGVIGYRTDQDANPIIETAIGGELGAQLKQEGKILAPIPDIGGKPARIEQRMMQIPDEETGDMIESPTEVPVWVDSVASGGTPMCHVLHYAYQLLEHWIGEHPNSFPPVLINITDGESSDGDPIPYAEAIKTNLATDDGNVLLFNCHLSMTAADSFLFPSNDELLPEELSKVLYKMSSVLPEPIRQRAKAEGFGDLPQGARGMAFNADMVCLIKFLDMGTRVAKNLR